MLKLLQECNKRNIAFKQAFYKSGMTEPDKQLKELSEEETFVAMANWIIHKLPPFHKYRLETERNDWQLTTGERELLGELLDT